MSRHLLRGALKTAMRTYSYSVAPAATKWNLVSSVCLQRKPIITREMNDLEKKVQHLLFQIDVENSWKNDWELEQEKDLKELEKLKTDSRGKDGDKLNVGRKLRQDFEDEWRAEFEQLRFEPRITEADKIKDVKSWFRCLDSTLILVVQTEGCGNRWILPHVEHLKGETMRQTAERAVRETCGKDLNIQFYGNAPCGYYKFKYPKEIRDSLGTEGEKIFFYKAFLSGGELKSSPVIKDFKWVKRSELGSTLEPKYCKSVEMFLFDEN